MVSLAIAYRGKGWNVRRGHWSVITLAVKRLEDLPRSLSIVNLISRADHPVSDSSELLLEFVLAHHHTALRGQLQLNNFRPRSGPEALLRGGMFNPCHFVTDAVQILTT